MKSSNLVHVLQKITPEDRRALRKFVDSPFHNHREDVRRLFRFLDERLKKDFSGLTNEAAHAFVYPTETFDLPKLRHCMSYLMAVVEKYFVVKELMDEPLEFQLKLSGIYNRMGMEKNTRRTLERSKSILSKNKIRDASILEKMHKLEEEKFNFTNGQKRTSPRNFEALNQTLDFSFLAKKLRQSCLALSHSAVANVNYDDGLLLMLLNYLEKAEWLDDIPSISLYFYCYRAATTGDEIYFSKLKNGLSESHDILPEKERRTLLLLAINFCIKKYNSGQRQYAIEALGLYKNGLENKLLLDNGKLSRFAFKNISSIAINLGEYEWMEYFISHFSENIDSAHRKNYVDFVKAKLFYAKGEMDAAMLLLHNVEYEDVFLNLDAKILLFKIYFELNEDKVLDNFISTFQRFLNRKKELGYHRENYTNTLLFARRLLALNPFDKTEKENLRSEIKNAKAVGEREWLLEQLG